MWQALKAACETDDETLAQAIVDSAGIFLPTGCMSDGVYDELGSKYVIPPYCFSYPTNLVQDVANKLTGVKSEVVASTATGSLQLHSIHNVETEESILLLPQTPIDKSSMTPGSSKVLDNGVKACSVVMRLSTGVDVTWAGLRLENSVSDIKRYLKLENSRASSSSSWPPTTQLRFMLLGRMLNDDMTAAEIFASMKRNPKMDALIIQVMVTGHE